MDIIKIKYFLGGAAGVCTSISFFPQMYKVITEKKADGLSYQTFFIHFVGLNLWILYGVLMKDIIILTFNIIALIMCLTIIIGILKYSGKNPNSNAISNV